MFNPEIDEAIILRMLNNWSGNNLSDFKAHLTERISGLNHNERLKILTDELAIRNKMIHGNGDSAKFLAEERIKSLSDIAIGMLDTLGSKGVNFNYTTSEKSKLKLRWFYKETAEHLIWLLRQLFSLKEVDRMKNFPTNDILSLEKDMLKRLMVYNKLFIEEKGTTRGKYNDTIKELKSTLSFMSQDLKGGESFMGMVTNIGEVLDDPKEIIEYYICLFSDFRNEIMSKYNELRNYFNDKLISENFPQDEIKRISELIQAIDEHNFINRQILSVHREDVFNGGTETQPQLTGSPSHRTIKNEPSNYKEMDLPFTQTEDMMGLVSQVNRTKRELKNVKYEGKSFKIHHNILDGGIPIKLKDRLIKGQFIEQVHGNTFKKAFSGNNIEEPVINWISKHAKSHMLYFIYWLIEKKEWIKDDYKYNLMTNCFLINGKKIEHTRRSVESMKALYYQIKDKTKLDKLKRSVWMKLIDDIFAEID